MGELTSEQWAVVHHPLGQHARVLAVAGSGKTHTMVHRVKHLVENLGVHPRRIGIFMFNRRARNQFHERLAEVIEARDRPEVHTFHSFAYNLLTAASQRSLLEASKEVWTGDKEELVRIYVHRAISDLVKQGVLFPDSVDPDEAIECIALWKGSLIPPNRAGHRLNPDLALVYKQFEALRSQKRAITFDDFVPLALEALETESDMGGQWGRNFDALIVDEYQDVNYGQQRLIEVLADKRADIMVVGDDDQTIYEWRGARPRYIVHDFSQVFGYKPTIDYRLSRTFRFGPLIAQCAQNVIEFNVDRHKKPLIAHEYAKESRIFLIEDTSEQPVNVNKELTSQLVALVQQFGQPQKIIVLGRMFSQFVGLEGEFLAQNVPYRVIGRSPFFERREIVVLLDYIRLALALEEEANPPMLDWLLSVANVPNRMLPKEGLSNAFNGQMSMNHSLQEILDSIGSVTTTPLMSKQRDQFRNLCSVLVRLRERITTQSALLAGELLTWLVNTLDYNSHFDHYYGNGENSEDRKRSVAAFCKYANSLHINVQEFIQHVESLDTTRGVPEADQIVMTTVFRVKGEEFDYVFIPGCEEGYMPYQFESGNEIYDTSGIVQQDMPSEGIDSERRLFYVAITRARKAVYIGTSSKPRQGNQSQSGQTLPSRFIHEAQISATEKVMSLVQRIAASDQQDQPEEIVDELVRSLANTVKQVAGYKSMSENLLGDYLPGLGLSVSPQTAQAIRKEPAVSFNYPPEYHQKKQAPVQMTARPSPPQQKKWWEDDKTRK